MPGHDAVTTAARAGRKMGAGSQGMPKIRVRRACPVPPLLPPFLRALRRAAIVLVRAAARARFSGLATYLRRAYAVPAGAGQAEPRTGGKDGCEWRGSSTSENPCGAAGHSDKRAIATRERHCGRARAVEPSPRCRQGTWQGSASSDRPRTRQGSAPRTLV